MRLLKKEKEALASLLIEGAASPEDLVDLFVKKLDELRGERTHVFACAVVAGMPITIGPVSTRNQAEKIVAKIAADRAWVVPGWTAEGWERHIAEVDTPPEPQTLNAKEEAARSKGFWAKVSQIREHEATAIVGKGRQDIEIKAVALPKGYWG
jgi:hypothetical protein